MRKPRKDPKFTCEACGGDAGTAGVVCTTCHKARCRTLLKSAAWCATAATRSGDAPGETLLETITREAQ